MSKEIRENNPSDIRDNANNDDVAILLNTLVRDLTNHPALEQIASDELGKEGWKKFIAQRYLIGRQFEHLLVLARTRASESGDTTLATVFKKT